MSRWNQHLLIAAALTLAGEAAWSAPSSSGSTSRSTPSFSTSSSVPRDMSVLNKYKGSSSTSSGAGGFYPASFSREKTRDDGGKTVFNYDSVSGRKTGTTIYNKDNKPVYTSSTTKDGTRVATNLKTGAQVQVSSDGKVITKTAPSGYVRQTVTAYDGSRLVSITRPSGDRFSYTTYPASFGRSQVYYYQPTSYSTFDNPWFWLWMSDSHHHHDTVVIHETRTTTESGDGSRGFTYDWKKVFPNLPESAIHVADYRNPVDWLVDHVINELISEKAPQAKSWWLTPLFGANKAGDKAAYELKGNDRLALADEVRRILGLMKEHKPVQISDMIDASTGEIKSKAALLLAEDVQTRDEETKDVCSLSSGDLIRLESFFPGASDVSVKVMKSDADGKAKEKCASGSTVSVRASQLQNAENDLVQRVERAMQQLAKEHEAGQLKGVEFNNGAQNENSSHSHPVVH